MARIRIVKKYPSGSTVNTALTFPKDVSKGDIAQFLDDEYMLDDMDVEDFSAGMPSNFSPKNFSGLGGALGSAGTGIGDINNALNKNFNTTSFGEIERKDGMDYAGNALKWGQAGAVFGPIGMGVGAAAGLIGTAVMDHIQAKKQRKLQRRMMGEELRNATVGSNQGTMFAPGGGTMLPIQAEKHGGQKEMMRLPNNMVRPTNADMSHEAMYTQGAGNAPTDFVPEGTDIYSARNKTTRKELETIIKYLTKANVQVDSKLLNDLPSKGKFSPADLAEGAKRTYGKKSTINSFDTEKLKQVRLNEKLDNAFNINEILNGNILKKAQQQMQQPQQSMPIFADGSKLKPRTEDQYKKDQKNYQQYKQERLVAQSYQEFLNYLDYLQDSVSSDTADVDPKAVWKFRDDLTQLKNHALHILESNPTLKDFQRILSIAEGKLRGYDFLDPNLVTESFKRINAAGVDMIDGGEEAEEQFKRLYEDAPEDFKPGAPNRFSRSGYNPGNTFRGIDQNGNPIDFYEERERAAAEAGGDLDEDSEEYKQEVEKYKKHEATVNAVDTDKDCTTRGGTITIDKEGKRICVFKDKYGNEDWVYVNPTEENNPPFGIKKLTYSTKTPDLVDKAAACQACKDYYGSEAVDYCQEECDITNVPEDAPQPPVPAPPQQPQPPQSPTPPQEEAPPTQPPAQSLVCPAGMQELYVDGKVICVPLESIGEYDPNAPFTEEPKQEPYPPTEAPKCPDRFVWNYITKKCVPVSGSSDKIDCPPNSTYDPNVGGCVPNRGNDDVYEGAAKDVLCPDGTVWDDDANSCVDIHQIGEGSCGDGFTTIMDYFSGTYKCIPNNKKGGGYDDINAEKYEAPCPPGFYQAVDYFAGTRECLPLEDGASNGKRRKGINPNLLSLGMGVGANLIQAIQANRQKMYHLPNMPDYTNQMPEELPGTNAMLEKMYASVNPVINAMASNNRNRNYNNIAGMWSDVLNKSGEYSLNAAQQSAQLKQQKAVAKQNRAMPIYQAELQRNIDATALKNKKKMSWADFASATHKNSADAMAKIILDNYNDRMVRVMESNAGMPPSAISGTPKLTLDKNGNIQITYN